MNRFDSCVEKLICCTRLFESELANTQQPGKFRGFYQKVRPKIVYQICHDQPRKNRLVFISFQS